MIPLCLIAAGLLWWMLRDPDPPAGSIDDVESD